MKVTLEDLIRGQLVGAAPIKSALARYGDEPAVFYQNAPDDTASGWNGKKQYPRIDYVVDYQRNPERKTSGTLTLNIWCAEDGIPPEEIEPHVRQVLCGVFLKSDEAPPYSMAWARSDPFDAQRGDSDNLVIGTTVTFDVYAFPTQITSDPDPVLAANEYIRKLVDGAAIIGQSDLPQVFTPTAQAPAFYFRLETLQTQRETNTVAWMDVVLAGHIFAAGEETKWLKAVVDALALDGEITMLDTSPMFITTLKADNTLDALTTGQLRIYARFGILRRKPYVHTLYVANKEYTTEGG